MLLPVLRALGRPSACALRRLGVCRRGLPTRGLAMGVAGEDDFRAFFGKAGHGRGVEDPAVRMQVEKDLARWLAEIRELYDAGDFAQACKFSEKYVEGTQKVFGDVHPAHGAALNNLALMYKQLGQHARAVQVYQRALQAYAGSVGKGHKSYVVTLQNLGATLVERATTDTDGAPADGTGGAVGGGDSGGAGAAAGTEADKQRDLEAAEYAFKDALETQRSMAGKERNDLVSATILNHLAGLEDLKGNQTEALNLYSEALTTGRMSGLEANDSLELATIWNNSGIFLRKIGRNEQAAQHLQQSVDIRKTKLGERNPATIVAKYNLAEALDASGLRDEANSIRESILESVDPQELELLDEMERQDGADQQQAASRDDHGESSGNHDHHGGDGKPLSDHHFFPSSTDKDDTSPHQPV